MYEMHEELESKKLAMKTLLILGASGLVGQQLLEQALARTDVAQVLAPTRRALAAHPRLLNPVVDFDQLPADAPWWRADAVLCALGSTMRQAGTREAFRRVDHDYVLAAAQLALRAGTPCFVLNSSLGADPGAGSFYLRVKGDTERDLMALGYRSLTSVRPSLLVGGPRRDARPGEAMAIALGRCISPLLPRRWRPIGTDRVAAVMLAAALTATPGVHVIESEHLHT